MSECRNHKLLFGDALVASGECHLRVLDDKPADTLDLECPSCGAKLFIYYRIEHAQEKPQESKEE